MKKLMLVVCLSLLTQAASAQVALKSVEEGVKIIETLVGQSSKSVEAANALTSLSKSLGVEASVLKNMSNAERTAFVTKAGSAGLSDIAYFGSTVASGSSVKGAESLNTLVHTKAGSSTATDLSAFNNLGKVPGMNKSAVTHLITLANANAIEEVPVALRAALSKNLLTIAELETLAQGRGFTVINKDAKAVCEKLTDPAAIAAKNRIEENVLAVFKADNSINTPGAYGKVYANELAQETGIALKEANGRVVELTKPLEEGGNCPFGSAQVYRAMLTL